MYKLAIFDFDGTLVDSAPGIIAVMCEVAREIGLPEVNLEHWKKLIGVPLNDQVDIILPKEALRTRRKIADRYREIYNCKAVELCPPFPDMRSTLQLLKDNNITISIATSKKRKIVDPVLEHHDLAHFFDLVIGATDVTKHKPDPESVLHTLKHLNFKDDQAVVIGDSTFDLDMAKNANVDGIGVTTGVHCHYTLSQSTPISIAKSLTEARDLVLKGRAPKSTDNTETAA